MRVRHAVVALAALLALAACGDRSTGATGPTYASAARGALSLDAGWVSAVGTMAGMPGMSMSDMPGMDAESAAYAVIANHGSAADALVSVSTPAARSATLHATRTSADGSSATMVAVHGGIPVPAGGRVRLRPGGYHVMLSGLRDDFAAGSTVPMTWTFRSGAHLTTDFPVVDAVHRMGGE